MVFTFIKGWKNIPLNSPLKSEIAQVNVSVIIALRDEETNIPGLIQGLKNQKYKDFELILVDDHSTDRTFELLQKEIPNFENAKLIRSEKSGKKYAITEGIRISNGEFIITTDADCEQPDTWIQSIVNYFLETKADFISAPVCLKSNGSIFGDLQEAEFLSLTGSGAGAIGIGKSILCNAANMAFKRSVWDESYSDLRFESISGDDVFLLLSIKKRKGKIVFLKSEEAIVTTFVKEKIKDFFIQRTRWSAKSKYYTDRDIVLVSLMVYITCLAQLLLLPLSFYSDYNFYLFIAFNFLKFAVDLLFLSYINQLYKRKNLFLKAFLLFLVYPFYITIVATNSFLRNRNQW